MKNSRRDTGLIIFLLLIILAAAAGLRFYNLGAQSLWADEGNSAALAGRSFAGIAADASNDIHPPLYYWLLHLWTRLFGTTEAALRSLSALIGTLLVLAVATLGTKIFNSATGLVAAAFAALAPFQVYYSQEARMYILAALEATLAVLSFCWYVSREDARLPSGASPGGLLPRAGLPPLSFSGVLLALVCAAGLYTHYAFALMIGLLTLLYGLWLIKTWRRGAVGWRALRWILLLVLMIFCYAPWLGIAVHQLGAWPRIAVKTDLLTQVRVLLNTLSLGPVAQNGATAWWGWLLPALALIGALPWPVMIKGKGRRDWLRLLMPVAWVLAAPAMILGLGLYREAYLKFLLIASPALALLLARALIGPIQWLWNLHQARAAAPADMPAGRRWWQSAAAILWTLSVVGAFGILAGQTLIRYYTDPKVARDDYRGIAQFIRATAHANDAILLTAPGQQEVFDYYFHSGLPIYPLPRERPLNLQATQAEMAKLLAYDKVYAIYWAAEEADPQGVIQAWMDSRGYKTLDNWHGNVRLAVYVMPERNPPAEVQDGVNVPFGNEIGLLGYRGWNLTPSAGEVTQLQLIWQAAHKLDRRYKVFLQLLDPRDQVIAQRDAEPAGEGRPTDTWQPGEVVQDNHGLLIPPGTPPGTYRRIIGLYDMQTMGRLRLPDGSDFYSLPPITVARSQTPPALEALNMMFTQRFDFGSIALLGHDRYKRGFGHAPETPINPGDRLHLTFYWQANAHPRADWWFSVTLSDSNGATVATLEAPLVSATYATTLWQEGDIVRGEHDLQLPDDLPPDTYRLSLVMEPDAKTQAGGPAYLGTVKVQPAAQ